jgi:hypothetical protein
MTTKTPLQKILQEICTQNTKTHKTMKEQAVPTTGEEMASKHRVALIQLHRIKP